MKIKKNKIQENIILPLVTNLLVFISFLFFYLFYFFPIIYKETKTKLYKFYKESFLYLSQIAVYVFYIAINSLSYSIAYFVNNNNLFKQKTLYYPIIANKCIIFVLSYFCTKFDWKNELISNTTFVSIFLYIIESITSQMKKLSLKVLLILQIVFVAILLLSIVLLIIYICFKYSY